jgi:hypothetical protein
VKDEFIKTDKAKELFCPEVSIRSATEDDHGFILNSWLKSYYDTADLSPRISREVFFKNEGKIIKELLRTELIKVICNPHDETHIYGYACYNDTPVTLHYIYVKQPFRKMGLAKNLLRDYLESEDVIVSYSTSRIKRFGKHYNFKYNPYVRFNHDL